MNLMKFFLVVFVAVTLSACGSSERKANKAEAKLNTEKVKISQQYQECIKKAEGAKDKELECDKYLKAAEALQ